MSYGSYQSVCLLCSLWLKLNKNKSQWHWNESMLKNSNCSWAIGPLLTWGSGQAVIRELCYLCGYIHMETCRGWWNHRMTEWLRMERTSGCIWSNLCSRGTSRVGCPILYPSGFSKYPRRRTHNSVLVFSHPHGILYIQTVFWHLEGSSCVPTHNHCLLFWSVTQQRNGSFLRALSLLPSPALHSTTPEQFKWVGSCRRAD